MTEDHKCRACGYSGEFGVITASSGDGYTLLLGCMPRPIGHVGAVDLLVCPACGNVTSTMRETIGIAHVTKEES